MNNAPISENMVAPVFTLPAALPDGRQSTIRLSDFKQRQEGLVLYFFPRDNTPGCTTETKDFSEAYNEIRSCGFDVAGVSTDALQSHHKFINKLNVPFALLTDDEGVVADKYGCYCLKKMYGKEFMGVERSTFLIGSNGKIFDLWRKVKVPGHVDDVVQRIRQL